MQTCSWPIFIGVLCGLCNRTGAGLFGMPPGGAPPGGNADMMAMMQNMMGNGGADVNRMQQQLMSNPEMMANIMNSPMMQVDFPRVYAEISIVSLLLMTLHGCNINTGFAE
jgi:hypothetical protein